MQLLKLRFAAIAMVIAVLAMLAPAALASGLADRGGNGDKGNDHGSNVQMLRHLPVHATDAAGNTFSGTLALTSFAENTDAATKATSPLLANGLLTGTVRDAHGKLLGQIHGMQVNNIPAAATASPDPNDTDSDTHGSHGDLGLFGATTAEAACQILHLVLGPINLNLLGLVLTTNTIVVDLTAVPGAGNLLGNLLCAVTNLLNPGGLLGGVTVAQLVAALNTLLTALGL